MPTDLSVRIARGNTRVKDGSVWPSSAVYLEFPIFRRTYPSGVPTRLHPWNV